MCRQYTKQIILYVLGLLVSHDQLKATTFKQAVKVYCRIMSMHGSRKYEVRMILSCHHHEPLTWSIYCLLCIIICLEMFCLRMKQQLRITLCSQGLMLSFVFELTWNPELWLSGLVSIAVSMFQYVTDQIMFLFMIPWKLQSNGQLQKSISAEPKS